MGRSGGEIFCPDADLGLDDCARKSTGLATASGCGARKFCLAREIISLNREVHSFRDPRHSAFGRQATAFFSWCPLHAKMSVRIGS